MSDQSSHSDQRVFAAEKIAIAQTPPAADAGVKANPDTATLSDLLLRFLEENPDQLLGEETPQDWVASMWRVRNPASKLKKSLDEFLAIFADFDGPAATALRNALEPLTK